MFKYFGSKYKLGAKYPTPAHGQTIVEPFGGSAAFSVLHRNVAGRVIIVEKDIRVVGLWHRLLSMSAAAIRDLKDPVAGERSTDLLVAFAGGRTTRDTPDDFIVSPRMSQRFRPMVNRIASVVDGCRHFEVICGDYRDAPDVDAYWFIDPPYAPTEGRWDRTRGGRYRHSNQDIDFAELSRWCRSRRGDALVCEQHGADWMPWTHSIDAIDGDHKSYGEVFWFAENQTHTACDVCNAQNIGVSRAVVTGIETSVCENCLEN